MRILALSDIYSNEYIIRELASKFQKKKFDIIILAGGYSYFGEKNGLNILESLLDFGDKVLFVPGGTDEKKIEYNLNENIINLDENHFIIPSKTGILGFLGLGGVPNKSIRNKIEFPYRWFESINWESIKQKLEMNLEKLFLEKVDFIILVSHSPPYHIADYSKKINLSELKVDIDDSVENLKRKSKNPIFLGSRILKEFIDENKIDLHIFGHVHKRGGKIIREDNTIFVNVAHLNPDPYKLTGRKVSLIDINKNIKIKFRHIVEEFLDFEMFLKTYL